MIVIAPIFAYAIQVYKLGSVMKTNYPHWTFHVEVLTRALNDLEATSTSEPGSSEFKFLRSEAPVILAEAREALTALKMQVRQLDHSCTCMTIGETQH